MGISIDRLEIRAIFETNKDAQEVIMQAVEKAMIEEALIYCRGNQSKAAEACGINRGTLRRRLTEYKIKKAVA